MDLVKQYENYLLKKAPKIALELENVKNKDQKFYEIFRDLITESSNFLGAEEGDIYFDENYLLYTLKAKVKKILKQTNRSKKNDQL